MAMDPVIFIDPGYGTMFETTTGEKPSYTDPADDGKKRGEDIFFRGKNYKFNPYCGVAFTADSKNLFCTDDGVNTALANLKNTTATSVVKPAQFKIKFSVYCNTAAVGFGVGISTSNTANTPNYLGITTVAGSKYQFKYPSKVDLLSEDNTGTLDGGDFAVGFHNVSLLVCRETSGITFGIAVDGNTVTLTQSDGVMPEEDFRLGIWLPAGSKTYYISNIIACYKGSDLGGTSFDKKIIPPETYLSALRLSDPADNKKTTFTPDTTEGKEGQWIGRLSGDQLLQTINVFDLVHSVAEENGETLTITEKDGSQVTVTDESTDEQKTSAVEKYGAKVEVATVVLLGDPAYKSKYFSRKVQGLYNSSSHNGYGEIPTDPDIDSTYCIDLQQHDKTLTEINGKDVGWKISG